MIPTIVVTALAVFGGTLAGFGGALYLIHKGVLILTSSQKTKYQINLPEVLYQDIKQEGTRLEWTASETVRWIIKLGLIALKMYGSNEGGICYKDELGTAFWVPFENTTETQPDDDLGPFKDYLDGLDLGNL